MSASSGMARRILTRQLRMKELYIGVNDNSGTPEPFGLDASQIVSITDNGTGDYTINLKDPNAYSPVFIVSVTPITADRMIQQESSTNGSITVQCFERSSGNAADTSFYLTLGVHENNYVF